MIALWWIRRDLRLADNQALEAALRAAHQVLPVFVLDPALLDSHYASEKRLAFLLGGLRELDAGLRRRGSYLVVRRGEPLAELKQIWIEVGASAVFAEPDYSPYSRQRDRRVAAELPVEWAGSSAIRPPGTILKSDGSPYTVYTPFRRAWLALAAPGSGQPAPDFIPTPPGIPTEALPEEPTLPEEVPFAPGEVEAERRLQDFTTGKGAPIYAYGEGRDRLDEGATSQLSPYLKFGMLSPRRAAQAVRAAQSAAPTPAAAESAQTWLNELVWRDFYLHILHHFPQVRRENFRPAPVAWQNDLALLEAWCAGRTGYPVIDAAMRQMLTSGWMHNRARMLVASFLTKDLLIDWRLGERFFMQHLIDGDPAANNGGWQWTAGTGTDAAPYFRIFNPILQSKKFDPQGAYIRRWLPELRQVPLPYLHEPWTMSEDLQYSTGCRIGSDYPAPIVDHFEARQSALQAYGQNKDAQP